MQSETAYGGTINKESNLWNGNINYPVQCCETGLTETQGCSHGYWKNVKQHPWPSDYSTTDSLSVYFGDFSPNLTLLGELKYNGNDWKSKLARKAVAALLNAESGMNYPLSVDEIKSRVSNKFQSGNESSIKYLHTQLENYNANNNFPLN